MERVFLHVDLDAFFASVEQLDNPSYRGRPVIVGGLPGDRRAVVSTASYEARAFGVHSAMPLATAVQKCPQAIFVRGRYARYHQKSEEVMNIFSSYSPTVIQISVDEAFIDITGTERLWGSPQTVAKRLQNEVREKTGLTVSIGLAPTMYLAKIASGLQKPNGFTVVEPGQEVQFMCSLPLKKLWGAGSKTLSLLNAAGIYSTAAIYEKPKEQLCRLFGESTGVFLYNAVRGAKDMDFGAEAKNHSISAETTYDFDLHDRYAIETSLMLLARTVFFRMHKEHVRSRTVALKIRYDDFCTVSVQNTSERAVMNEEDMFKRCTTLFFKKYDSSRGIRLLGVACENVEPKSVPVQKELFDFADTKRAKVEEAIYALESRHPEIKIRKARFLQQ